jgi:cysteinyl-tRNA synthetase
MPLRLYNTLSRKLEVFSPITPGQVGMYTCGPTVYHFAHIGNLRTYVFEDLLKRALLLEGLRVEHVMNITDVGHLTSDQDSGEDKMEQGAAREGKSVWEIAAHYTRAFQADLARLNILPPSIWCKATDHIPEQIALVERLFAKGFAYSTADGVYFDTIKFPNYGALARKDVEGQIAGARVELAEGKRSPTDFALWKRSPQGSHRLMEWDSPWGIGFPGWHLECSAMSMKYLGEHFDIHCGGIDHIPVHHTNEIAQSEAATGRSPWVNVWMHGEFLVVDKGKMSKSSGEFLTLSVVEGKGFHPLDYRYLLLSAHYRFQLSFSLENLDQARAGRANLMEKLKDLAGVSPANPAQVRALPLWLRFLETVEDDLNAPRALACAWEAAKDRGLQPGLRAGLLAEMDRFLGLDLLKLAEPAAVQALSAEEAALLKERSAARAAKDWALSDSLRQQAEARFGLLIKDTKQGQTWARR